MSNEPKLTSEHEEIEGKSSASWPFWIFWGPLVAVISVLIIIIIWLLIPGNRIFLGTNEGSGLDNSNYLNLINEENASLLRRAQQLEAALEESVCMDDGTLLLPDGRTPEGIKPYLNNDSQSSIQESLPNALIPNSPREIVIPNEQASNLTDFNQDSGELSLVDLIKLTTVLILNPASETLGSGFFVSPNLIITNKHIVDGGSGKFFIGGHTLKSGAEATLLAASGPVEVNGDDFALLELQDVNNPYLNIRIPQESIQLHNVVAAGFPGDVLELVYDQAFGESLDALPSVYITEGTVNGETNYGSGNGLILHSAPISQGNSGGPLLDSCGNVLGVNTLIQTGDARTISIALPAKQLKEFLSRNNVSVSIEEGNCTPLVSSLEAPKFDDSEN